MDAHELKEKSKFLGQIGLDYFDEQNDEESVKEFSKTPKTYTTDEGYSILETNDTELIKLIELIPTAKGKIRKSFFKDMLKSGDYKKSRFDINLLSKAIEFAKIFSVGKFVNVYLSDDYPIVFELEKEKTVYALAPNLHEDD